MSNFNVLDITQLKLEAHSIVAIRVQRDDPADPDWQDNVDNIRDALAQADFPKNCLFLITDQNVQVTQALSGAEMIVAERFRQIHVKGFDAANDALWADAQMAQAAAHYANPHSEAAWYVDGWHGFMRSKPGHDRIRQLVIAGALIAAEIDRLKAMENVIE